MSTHSADLTDYDVREKLMADLLGQHGGVDILVNNAGDFSVPRAFEWRTRKGQTRKGAPAQSHVHGSCSPERQHGCCGSACNFWYCVSVPSAELQRELMRCAHTYPRGAGTLHAGMGAMPGDPLNLDMRQVGPSPSAARSEISVLKQE